MEPGKLHGLVASLSRRGYTVVGPTLRDNVIAYNRITSADDLPAGLTCDQDAGQSRTRQRDDGAFFGYAVGPRSLKDFLYPSRSLLCRLRGDRTDFAVESGDDEAPRYAFLGVRSCELHAMALQDAIFLQGAHVDPIYQARREACFIVAVNCGVPGGTCFCVSMGTGPKASRHYDIVLTEVCGGGQHYFTAESGSDNGASVIAELSPREATLEEVSAATHVVADAEAKMGRTMEAADVRELLERNATSPRWERIAERCLSCANCTMVCPTCFCSTVEDVTSLSGASAERWRVWDSCFTMNFSYIHGGHVRKTSASRYRQWITHKLSSWHNQFGASGCVGCGRCITWCPVGIDITEEVAAIRRGSATDTANGGDESCLK